MRPHPGLVGEPGLDRGVHGILLVAGAEEDPGEASRAYAAGRPPPDHHPVFGPGEGHVEQSLLVTVGRPVRCRLASVVVRIAADPLVPRSTVHVSTFAYPVDVGLVS